MGSIINQFLSLVGINSAPTTGIELLWDVVIILVGLYFVKYVILFVVEIIKSAMKLN